MDLGEGRYTYFDDFDRLSSSTNSSPYTSANGQVLPSPINLDHLALYLSSYIEQRLAAYIVSGIWDRFRIEVFGLYVFCPLILAE